MKKSKKRGQVTIFIILAIFIVIIFIVFIALRSGTIKKGAISDLAGGLGFSADVDGVKSYAEGCLERVMWDAISTYANVPFTDDALYIQKLKGFIEGSLTLCTDFSEFEGLEITDEEVRGIKVDYTDPTKKAIYADVGYYLLIKKGDDTETLSKLYKEVELGKSCCVPISVNAQCKATESKTLTDQCSGFTYTLNTGSYVTDNGLQGGNCIAC